MTQTLPTTGAEEVRWDLSALYASPQDPAIEATLAEAVVKAQRFEERYRGRLEGMVPAEFAVMMRELEEVYELTARPRLYSHLVHTQDTADPAAGRLVARVRDAAAEWGRHLVFFSLEMAELSDEQAARLAADPETAAYRHTIEDHRKYLPHRLSEAEERLLNDLSPVGIEAWVRLFQELSAAIRATVDDREIPLAQALPLLREADRDLRRRASGAITEALRRDIRTRASVFNVVLAEHAIGDRLRRFPTWISDRNLANQTSDEAVAALVEAVTGRYDVVARYYRVKRGLLGLDRLFEWDRYAPVAEVTRRLAWDEARDLVLASYDAFSPRAGRLARDFFRNRWIDAPIVPGKEMGAYCAGATPRLPVFVMVNFTGRLDDALTLAHELGHGLHYRLASRQHVFDYHAPLTLAETASIFGQTLTLDRILAEERDDRVKLAMLCDQVETAMGTIFRQVAFHRFEEAAHTARRTEGELSVEQLGDLWQERLQAMFGDSLTLTDEHRDWWSYVEHFVRSPGYVYAYAFGNLLAFSLYRRYRERGAGFVDPYLDLLAAGGSRRPDELVRSVGMDLADPGFWDAGLQILDEMVDRVEELAAAEPPPGGARR
jgi:oligoendopeptidase F